MPVLCLDFDGTMTDAEAEGRPFRDGYLEDLCLLVGRKPGDPEVLAIAEATEAEIAAAPHAHPFLWMGRPVAPATAWVSLLVTIQVGLPPSARSTSPAPDRNTGWPSVLA